METFRRFGIAHLLRGRITHEPEIVHHEDGENRPHPIEAEPLGRLVSDDVGNARGHLLGLESGAGVGGGGHVRAMGRSSERK